MQTTANAIDPTEWTGNQRVSLGVIGTGFIGFIQVLHFGPLAQRDPFFYYYPKGWDILYPAQFGEFSLGETTFTLIQASSRIVRAISVDRRQRDVCRCLGSSSRSREE